MTTDPIAAARALIEPLTGYTPGPWEPFFGEAYRVRSDGMNIATAHFVTLLDRIPTKVVASNTCLIASAPDLRDMVATLADALEAERAKVAAAYEAAASVPSTNCWLNARESATMPDSPERIWAKIHGASTDVMSGQRGLLGAWHERQRESHTAYVREDLVTAMEAENQRLRATLSAITATDCYSRDECTDMARAALRSMEASHDD